MQYITKILSTEFATHDVKWIIIEKPAGYTFKPGNATDVSINKPKWKYEKRPFTFSNLNKAEVLEFFIKSYPDHKGVTNEIHKLVPGDELIIEGPWGNIEYKGKGVFFAAGTGLTPFIAIFRDLLDKGELKGNKFIYSNKTSEDIILEKELKNIFNDDLILTLTKETKQGYLNERVNKEFLEKYIKDFNQKFYICGPRLFVNDISEYLLELGANGENIIIED